MAQPDEDGGVDRRLTSVEKKELAELRRKNRQLEMDNLETRSRLLRAGELS
jgi:hypothetical protein